MRIGLDVTALLGPRTGIGNYTSHLIDELATQARGDDGGDGELVATAFTIHSTTALARGLPHGVRYAGRRFPAAWLQAAWRHVRFPPVEAFCGRVDVFHATNFVLPPALRARGVVTIHDLAFVRFPELVTVTSRRLEQLVPRSIERAAVICTPSAAVADEVAHRYGVERESIVVTPLGVDASWFAATPPDAALRARLDLPQRYLLAVGTLEPRKNLPGLLAAYRLMLANEPATPPLVLVGPPGWGPALQLDELPPGSVRLTSYLDDASLQRVVAGAGCLVFPSLYEGFGLPPLEALACGVAVVATDLPVTREVLGDQARFVPAGDVEALAQACAQTLAPGIGPDTEATAAARRRQAGLWSWQRCAEQAREAYRRALLSPHTGG